MKRKATGRALFYTRDSGGQHEMTPTQYVDWASRKAQELELCFSGTPQRIEAMIRDECAVSGDLFLDYGVKGNTFSRPGLDALIREAHADLNVSHVLIPRRDRLARPDDPFDGVILENKLRGAGITLVFMDRVCPPLARGQKRDIADLIVAAVDYDKSGKERRDLAEKIIFAQIGLASLGYSVGGRPPYGFRRALIREDGTVVRWLVDGERVKMRGHHVVWLPGPEEELRVVRRIVDLLETMPASRVAALLMEEGISSPDSGRQRKDRGIRHTVSGVWHQSVIVSIARNPLLICMAPYGRRSMGDKLRFSRQGPRELADLDFRTDGKVKVVQNPESVQIKTPVPVKFDPVIEPARWKELIARLEARAGTQRGKPRSQDPAKNPLGCRVFDMNCTWPMYRTTYGGSFRYVCGLYQQSHAQKCTHNHVDGPNAVCFLLACLRQRLLSTTLLPKLQRRLEQIAARELCGAKALHDSRSKHAALANVRAQLEKVTRNLALADTPEQYGAVAAVFEDLTKQERALQADIAALPPTNKPEDARAEVAAAMALAQRLPDLASEPGNFAAIGELFRQINVRLFLRFREVREGKRTLNKLGGGVVTFGSAPPPIATYLGPTSRKKIKGSPAPPTAEPRESDSPSVPKPLCPGREGDSLGNVSRGDWIRTSDLLNPIQAR